MAGKGNGKPVTPPVDKLNFDDLAKMNGISPEIFKLYPDLNKVFTDAVAGNWMNSPTGKALFDNALSDTGWMKENGPAVRKYLITKYAGGGDWDVQVRDAQAAVKTMAVRIGAKLSDTDVATFADQYLMNGWNDPARAGTLEKALTGQYSYQDGKGQTYSFTTDHMSYDMGAPAKAMQTLRQAANANSVTYGDGYYTSAARAIAGGLGTVDDYLADIREHAANSHPVFGDKIRAGFNVKDLAQPYVTQMANTLEMNPNDISLDDPMIKQAMGGIDEKGNPTAMGGFAFDKALRSHEKWQYTKAASQQVGDMTQSILKMFGYGG